MYNNIIKLLSLIILFIISATVAPSTAVHNKTMNDNVITIYISLTAVSKFEINSRLRDRIYKSN